MWLNRYIRPIKFSTSELLILGFMITIGCKSENAIKDLEPINGYWIIEKVVFPDGEEKNFTLSSTVDYFELVSGNGFRKKLQPQLNGKFSTSDDAISFTIENSDDGVFFIFGKGADQWKEELRKLNTEEMILVSTDKIAYHYMRFQPLGTEKDGN